MNDDMSYEVAVNYGRYKLRCPGHSHQVYVSAAGKWNVWDNNLWARIGLEPEWFEQDMEQYVRKEQTV